VWCLCVLSGCARHVSQHTCAHLPSSALTCEDLLPQPPQTESSRELFLAQPPKANKFPDWIFIQRTLDICSPSLKTFSFASCHYGRDKLLIVFIHIKIYDMFLVFQTRFFRSNIKIYDIFNLSCFGYIVQCNSPLIVFQRVGIFCKSSVICYIL